MGKKIKLHGTAGTHPQIDRKPDLFGVKKLRRDISPQTSSAQKRINISAIILQGGNYNKDLYKKCLASLGWVDEVVKIDVPFLRNSFSDYRNLGAKKARGIWLLYVDTDEIVSEALRNEIVDTIGLGQKSGYAIPRKNIVFNKEMRHCGLWPDYVLRLIKKESLVGWQGDLHEQPKISGQIGYLSNPLIHHKHSNLSDMVTKTNNWSEIEARLMFEANHPPMNFFRFASAGIREFWNRMIIQTAFLDGTEGVIYGLYQVYSRLISYSKLWELQLKKGLVK